MGGPTNGGRSKALDALRESDDLYRVVLSNVSDAVFLTDDEGRFTFVCPNVDVIFGFVPDEVHAMQEIRHLLGESLFDRAKLAAEGEIRNIEREITSKSGASRTILAHIKKVSIGGGTVLYACRDVTERKAAEKEAHNARLELNHASRLALIGELVASIVHEVKQPLTSVSANAEAGIRLLSSDEKPDRVTTLREILTDVCDQSRHAEAVIERLRTLARKQAFEVEMLDVNEVLSELARLVRGEAQRRGISLHLDLGTLGLTVSADRVCLRQIMLNLILNAMDAVDQMDQEKLVFLRTRSKAEMVEIMVSDTGPGISPEHAPRIFDAFFTTKQEGLGLGLTLARSLAEAQRGRVSIVDTGGRGATFSVTLPAQAGPSRNGELR
jgi:PAS domain S-box-containing protein